MPANIATVPLSAVALWPRPNYIDPVRQTVLIPLAAVLQTLTTVFVGLRIYLRARNQAGPFRIEDAFMIPAFLASTAFTAVSIVAVTQCDLGTHIWNVPFDRFEGLARYAWICEVLFLLTTTCTKTSVLLFVRGLSQGAFARRWYWTITAAIIFTWMCTATWLLMLCLTCRPLYAYWKAYDFGWKGEWKCTDTRVTNIINGVFTVFSDVYSVLLPVTMLRHLNCSRRQKIALNTIFSLGLVVVAAGCARTYYGTKLGYSYDPSWTGYYLNLWSNLEVQLSIICASAPALRVFFRRYLRHSSSPSPGGGSSGGGRIQRSLKLISDRTTVDLSSHDRDNFGDDRPLTKEPRSVESILWGDDDVGEAVIRSPADYEAYNLRSLDKVRPTIRAPTAKLPALTVREP